MNLVGADVQQLERLALQLDRAAHLLQSASSQLNAQVRSAAWHGPNGARFKQDWAGSHRPGLQFAVHALHHAAVLIRRNAQQQRMASAAGTAASSSPHPTAPGSVNAKKAAEIKEYKHALDMLAFAKDATGANPPGYHRLNSAELKELGLDSWMLSDKTGLQFGVYRGPDGKYVVAFAGSNTSFQDPTAYGDIAADWIGNNAPGIGGINAQEIQAMEIAKQLQQHGVANSDVEYVGHSLGGQLAATAAMVSGSHAVTFNAAPVSPGLLFALGGRENSESLIVNYRMGNDFVARQEYIVLDRTPAGREVYLAGTGDDSVGGQFDAHGNLEHIENGLHDELRFRGVDNYSPADPKPVPDYSLPKF